MPAAKLERRDCLTVVESYDVAADAKKANQSAQRQDKIFSRVKDAVERRLYTWNRASLVAAGLISARTMKMIEQSAANLKKGRASAPIDFATLPKGLRIASMVFQHPDGCATGMEAMWNDLVGFARAAVGWIKTSRPSFIAS